MDLALADLPDIDALRASLRAAFPDLVVAVTDGVALDSSPDVWIDVSRNESEFPVGLSVSATLRSGCDFEAWLHALGLHLSTALSTQVICDGSRYGDRPAPYWSLIWDSGKARLADDSDTLFADGQGGPVRTIRQLDEAAISATLPELQVSVQPRPRRHPQDAF